MNMNRITVKVKLSDEPYNSRYVLKDLYKSTSFIISFLNYSEHLMETWRMYDQECSLNSEENRLVLFPIESIYVLNKNSSACYQRSFFLEVVVVICFQETAYSKAFEMNSHLSGPVLLNTASYLSYFGWKTAGMARELSRSKILQLKTQIDYNYIKLFSPLYQTIMFIKVFLLVNNILSCRANFRFSYTFEKCFTERCKKDTFRQDC